MGTFGRAFSAFLGGEDLGDFGDVKRLKIDRGREVGGRSSSSSSKQDLSCGWGGFERGGLGAMRRGFGKFEGGTGNRRTGSGVRDGVGMGDGVMYLTEHPSPCRRSTSLYGACEDG